MTFYEQLTLAMNQLPWWGMLAIACFGIFFIGIIANWIILPFKIGRIGNELAKLREYLTVDLRQEIDERVGKDSFSDKDTPQVL